MIVTVVMSLIMIAGLFLMLWSALALIQDKRLFFFVPKKLTAVIHPRGERFPGARRLGWRLMITAVVMVLCALFYAGLDGVKQGFGYWQFFIRYVIILLAVLLFDILIINDILFRHLDFFPRYYPEAKGIEDVFPLGYKWRKHLLMIVLSPVVAAALAGLCVLYK